MKVCKTIDLSFLFIFFRNLIRGQLLPYHDGDLSFEEPGGKFSYFFSYKIILM